MLFAQRENCVLALASSAPWLKRSAGFVGYSRGWQAVTRNRIMTVEYGRAEPRSVRACLAGVAGIARWTITPFADAISTA